MLRTYFNRQIFVSYVLPAACLILALLVQSDALQLEQAGTAMMVIIAALSICLVFATVFVALHHAEAIAHHVGEPYGTLILTFAVTTIEV